MLDYATERPVVILGELCGVYETCLCICIRFLHS